MFSHWKNLNELDEDEERIERESAASVEAIDDVDLGYNGTKERLLVALDDAATPINVMRECLMEPNAHHQPQPEGRLRRVAELVSAAWCCYAARPLLRFLDKKLQVLLQAIEARACAFS